MTRSRSFSQITKDMVDRLRLVQPNLDTKPGSVSRDLFIDLQADEVSKLYSLISLVSNKQSFATASGSDLDKLSRNFGFIRKQGSNSSGTVIFSLDSIDRDIEIPEGTIVSTRSGVSFRTIGNYSMMLSEKNIHAANASRVKKQLDISGASTKYAIEVPIVAINTGTSGNVGSYQVVSQSAPFNFFITNISSTSGGSNLESDSAFRRRFLSGFSGAGVGTSLGYSNAILEDSNVLSLLVVEPGNVLMLRDGTEILEGDFNSRRISSSGSGGKVDIYVLGKSLREISESFIFFNKSTSGDISSPVNDYVLGNKDQDTSMTSLERRNLSLSGGSIPLQPVDSIISVSGLESGSLTEGVNFKLIKDYNSDTGGSPFGFDKIRFISNKKYISGEIISKKTFGSSDALEFPDARSVSDVFENIGIEDENSTVLSYDKSMLQLNHSPITSVSRVFNFTTGEVYSLEDIGLNNDGLSLSGIIRISGKQLPSVTDKLKVDYIWKKRYSPYSDYVGDPIGSNVDWSESSRKEELVLLQKTGNNFYLDMTDDILKVNNVLLFSSGSYLVEKDQSSLYVDVSSSINNVYDVKFQGVDIFNTEDLGFSTSGTKIYLSSDSGASEGEMVDVRYNTVPLYSFDNVSGSFQENKIFLPEDNLLKTSTLLSANAAKSTSRKVIVDFSVYSEKMVPSISLSDLPITSSLANSRFLNSSLSPISGSYKPSEKDSGYFTKYSPSRLRVTAESISSSGVIKIIGDTITTYSISVEAGLIFNGDKVNLKNYMNGDGIAKVMSMSLPSGSFGLNGYKTNNSLYSNDAITDATLLPYEFRIPSIIKNNKKYTDGEMLSITFSSYKKSDISSLYFYEDSQLETDKIYLNVSSISVTSGFLVNSEVTGGLSVEFGNQPSSGDQYKADYNFKAPKDGERIFISFNQNRVISDATLNVESSRPITADVLIKEATELPVDVIGSIVVSDDYIGEGGVIRDNVTDQLANLLSSNRLGGIIDYSDVLRVMTNVTGVESADISLFNYKDKFGRKDFVRALDNQSITPNLIDISVVSRKDFRIS